MKNLSKKNNDYIKYDGSDYPYIPQEGKMYSGTDMNIHIVPDGYLSFTGVVNYKIESAEDHPLIKMTIKITNWLYKIAEKFCDFSIWLECKIIAKRRKKRGVKNKTN